MLSTICCCLLYYHMTWQLTVDNEGMIAWGWFTTDTWWRWVVLWWVQGTDIQVTEWVNVNNKFSDGEKTGMWARTSHWHDSEKKRCMFIYLRSFNIGWVSVDHRKNIKSADQGRWGMHAWLMLSDLVLCFGVYKALCFQCLTGSVISNNQSVKQYICVCKIWYKINQLSTLKLYLHSIMYNVALYQTAEHYTKYIKF